MHHERVGARAQRGLVREAERAELAALLRQRRGDAGPRAHAHHEHYLIVAVVLREWTLEQFTTFIHMKTDRNFTRLRQAKEGLCV